MGITSPALISNCRVGPDSQSSIGATGTGAFGGGGIGIGDGAGVGTGGRATGGGGTFGWLPALSRAVATSHSRNPENPLSGAVAAYGVPS